MATILVAVFCAGEFESIKIREGQSLEWGYGFCAGMEVGALMYGGGVSAYVVPDEEARMRHEATAKRTEEIEKAFREAADIRAKLGAHDIDTNDGDLSVLGCDPESPRRQALKAETTEPNLIARLSLAIRKAWAAPPVGTSSEQAARAVIAELAVMGMGVLGGPLSGSDEMLETASDYAARTAAELWAKGWRAIIDGRNVNQKMYDAFQAGARWAYNRVAPIVAAKNEIIAEQARTLTQTPASSGERWAVACQCDDAPMRLFTYSSGDEARIAFDTLNAQWSQTYLVTIVAGPQDSAASWRPPLPDMSMELLRQRDAALAEVERMKTETIGLAAHRKEVQEIILELERFRNEAHDNHFAKIAAEADGYRLKMEAEAMAKRVRILEIAPKAAHYATELRRSTPHINDAHEAAKIIERGRSAEWPEPSTWSAFVLEYAAREGALT